MAALCACAPAKQETTLKFWTFGREGEVVGELLVEFERAHPGVHLVVQNMPLTAAHEKLLTAFAGDALPDLCQLGNTWIPEFAALGALEPLQTYVDKSNVVRRDDYFAGIWDTNVVDGGLYGVSWYVDTRLLFYRKDLLAAAGFEDPPRDWDEWRRAMAAIKRSQGADKYAIFLPLNEFEPLLNLAIQQPDPLLVDDGTRGNFESAGFRRALDFYVEAFRENWAPPMSNTQIANVWDEFGKGYFAFYITGPWNIGEFKRRLPTDVQGHWGTAPLPGADGPGGGAAGGSSFAIFRASKHKQLAWELVEFLSEVEQQQRFYSLTGDLPARRSAWDFEELETDEYTHAFRDQLERVKPTPKVPEWERIANEMQLAAERVVRGGESADSALRALDAKIDDVILAKRRSLLAKGAKP
ncbi:MAG: sugar ABC transporter substrate-binding protein [Rudaea sp.]|uniref:sugar ABC transporter substrate-binding protein n=1 Tax=unclassified Rudaea TaxID=2627037 RepID=UPI0010F5A104|nr:MULTISPECIES: sugar ABC transporter substrate-binding protein [unclassified Rudaea]MBN8885584.1 sugar ABC transporter substrate-binding protein [Rudaea sp.]MBR0344081.1 sugar ABC transporter substrate-binding protein [Rudaea sp.]